jgi:hypothetical protein
MIKFKKLFLIILPFIIVSCYEDITENPIGNQSPDTGLSLFPVSTLSGQPSMLRVSWWGDDPDGLVIGYYFSWDGLNWSFTERNVSLFSLDIGVVDSIYVFRISAVDQEGNGRYDIEVVQNNISYGPEPFVDANQNGIYDSGEFFFDIGLIDPSPAELSFPIKNSAPVITWNTLSVLPDTSFPVMSFGWDVEDIDGNETIDKINISLNDTTNFVSINGSIRIVTVRIDEFSSSTPLMEILIEGNPNNIVSEKLPGLKFNDNNIFYAQAVDFSGAKSPFIKLPGDEENWYVKKPVGQLLVIDDYTSFDDAAGFYSKMMDSLSLSGKHDVYDINTNRPPYINITFLETIKLFDYALWYSDNNPSIDIAVSSIQKYLDAGNKLFFTTQFPQTIDLENIKGFLTSIITDSSDSEPSIPSNVIVSADTSQPGYPQLQTTSSLFRIKSFFLDVNAIPIYYFPTTELNGYIGFINSVSSKNLFFIGLPLHKLNGGSANVKSLLEKVLFQEFGLIP